MKSLRSAPKYDWVIYTHRRPHIDEIFAILLLLKYGEEMYPGITTGRVKVCFWGINNPRLKRMSTAMLLANRRIVIGIRVEDRSDLDEHGTAKEVRRMGECTATLMAKHLKIQDDPQIQVLLETVRKNDLYGYGNATDLSKMLELKYDLMPEAEAYMWAYNELKLLQNRQSAIWSEETGQLVAKLAEVETVTAIDGYEFSFWSVESNPQSEAEAKKVKLALDRIRAEHSPSVLSHQDIASGFMAVFFNHGEYIDRDGIVHDIRVNELRKRGLPIPKDDGEALATKEEADGFWYYFQGQTPQGERTPKSVFSGGVRTSKCRRTLTTQTRHEVNPIIRVRLRETVQSELKPKGRAKRAAKR